MVHCGLKLTHDAAVTVIDNGKLIFSIELEKLNNNPRYASIEDTSIIGDVLIQNNYPPEKIDFFAVDGWGGYNADELAVQPRLKIGTDNNFLMCTNHGAPYELKVAQYIERNPKSDILSGLNFEGLKIGNRDIKYSSYLHVTGHVLSAYCSSPFPGIKESSYVLIWDGGMFPYLYYVDFESVCIDNLGPVFTLIGNIYTIFSQHFNPFKVDGVFAKDDLSVAGKVMAYIAYGKLQHELFAVFDRIIIDHYNHPMGFANVFANEFKKSHQNKFSDADVLLTFHVYLEKLIIEKLRKKISRYPKKHRNLCIAGGCGLNIKWNSKIRGSQDFSSVYVPPFPNDSGSSIGMACALRAKHERIFNLDWSVYSGPMIVAEGDVQNWTRRPCPLRSLAEILYSENAPVVFLNGRAELGPRALGNRSIIASPQSSEMKNYLNKIKNRESYRPVSPICLEHRAKDFFECEGSDPFMLFDHLVRADKAALVPAICHLDGSARLQTINREQNSVVAELLEEFEKLSGIPFLCNTSANFKDKGFFPDVRSAMEWGGVKYIWCEGNIYTRN